MLDSYFSPHENVVTAEEHPDATRKMIQNLLVTFGLAIVVSVPTLVRAEGQFVQIESVITIYENVRRNRSDDGIQKRAEYAGTKCWALLEMPGVGWSPAEFYDRVRVERLEMVACADDGTVVWELPFTSGTTIDLLIQLIGTDLGEAIGDENSAAFIYASNTQ